MTYSAITKPMLDGANPYSLVSAVEGDAFKNAVAKIPSDLLEMDETQLRTLAKPTRTDYAIRTALWNEFRLVHSNKGSIKPARVYGGICGYNHWYYQILAIPAKLAWVLQPMNEFEKGLEPLLGRVVERYDELINLNIYDAKGQPVPALARIVLEAMKMVEFRLRGTAVQRLETKNLTVNQSVDFEPDAEVGSEEAMARLQKRLKELEIRERASRNVPVIDIDALSD